MFKIRNGRSKYLFAFCTMDTSWAFPTASSFSLWCKIGVVSEMCDILKRDSGGVGAIGRSPKESKSGALLMGGCAV